MNTLEKIILISVVAIFALLVLSISSIRISENQAKEFCLTAGFDGFEDRVGDTAICYITMSKNINQEYHISEDY